MSPRTENPTVYTTEAGRVCPNCGKPQARCECHKKSAVAARPKGDGIARVRIESKGRGGKTVSLVEGLEVGFEELKKISVELKRTCGAGGAVKEGVIEIQGDHRDTLVTTLQKLGYKAKRAGG